MTGECVQTGHQEQRGGGHSGASQKENGAGSSGHPENGHHGPDRAQPGHSFQVSLTITLSVSVLYSPTTMMYTTTASQNSAEVCQGFLCVYVYNIQ